MAMQFEYDDKGTTFYYFLLSFFAMVLLPATYFLWPDKKSQCKYTYCYCKLVLDVLIILCLFFVHINVDSVAQKLYYCYILIFLHCSFCIVCSCFNSIRFLLLTAKQKKGDKPCYCSPCMEKRDLLKRKEPSRKTLKYIT